MKSSFIIGFILISKLSNQLEEFILIQTFLGISSVNHLDLDFINNPSINWSPPSFYSDDIPQGSITTYHVIVKRQDGSLIVDVNTTDTFYQLPSNLTVDCNSYNVSVTAFIEQYSSHDETITEENIGSNIILIIYKSY